ncbi:hypothetical protein E5288_WYG017396 [Bos mutus]|uniref:Uncharacterized protein n=1 Tax=Bos mutus TaxID=72004 RepID=A0A6B0RQ46_9CETA|nr:hypothetical protein [Bos mutus]
MTALDDACQLAAGDISPRSRLHEVRLPHQERQWLWGKEPCGQHMAIGVRLRPQILLSSNGLSSPLLVIQSGEYVKTIDTIKIVEKGQSVRIRGDMQYVALKTIVMKVREAALGEPSTGAQWGSHQVRGKKPFGANSHGLSYCPPDVRPLDSSLLVPEILGGSSHSAGGGSLAL